MRCIICGKEVEKSHYMNAVLCSDECFRVNLRFLLQTEKNEEIEDLF